MTSSWTKILRSALNDHDVFSHHLHISCFASSHHQLAHAMFKRFILLQAMAPSSTPWPSLARHWQQRDGLIGCKQLGCVQTSPATTWTLGFYRIQMPEKYVPKLETILLGGRPKKHQKTVFWAMFCEAVKVPLGLFLRCLGPTAARAGCVRRRSCWRPFSPGVFGPTPTASI